MLAIAAGFGADQMIYHSQFLIVMRDPGSYAQFAVWIAGHHGLPIPQDRAAFGGTHHLLTFDSFAFYQVGSVIVPQFMAGLPMLLAGGFWLGGAATAVAMAPVFGALAVLTFGGLARGVTTGIRQAGLQPVLLAATRRELRPYGAPAHRVMALRTRQDPHTLVTPPKGTWKLAVNVWMSEPPR